MEKHDVDYVLNLRRFLYVCNENNKFVAGDPFAHKYFTADKLKSLKELHEAARVEDIVQVLQKAELDKHLPQKAPLLFALASCVSIDNTKLKTAAYELVKKTCESTEELLLFLKFYKSLSDKKGFGSGFKRCVNGWYLKLKPIEFAEVVTKYRSRHGWSHKNLFEMTRPKTDEEPKSAVLKYVMHGYESFESLYGNDEGVRPVFEFVRRVEEFKHCEDPKEAGKMITRYGFSSEYFPAHLVKCPELWEAAVSVVPLKELLAVLPRLQNYGLLRYQSSLSQKIIDAFDDGAAVAASGVHPVEVTIALYDYVGGGKYPDFKKTEYLKTRETTRRRKESEPASEDTDRPSESSSRPSSVAAPSTVAEQRPRHRTNNNVTAALRRLLNVSFKNVRPTNLSYMVSVDARDHMEKERCFKCGNVTAMKAAVVIALYLVKSEKRTTVAVFNDRGVVPVALDKNMTANQAETCLLEAEKGHVRFQTPFVWAQEAKKKIDVFVNVFHSPKVYVMMPKELRSTTETVGSALDTYRKKMKKPDAKVVSICLCRHNYSTSSRMVPGMLDVCGFGSEVPGIIEAFARGSFA